MVLKKSQNAFVVYYPYEAEHEIVSSNQPKMQLV